MSFDEYGNRLIIIVSILEGICSIFAIVVSENKILVGSIAILVFIIVLLAILLYLEELYIRFIGYLLENKYHRFELLPAMRMYLRTKKMRNKIRYNSINVTYNIKHKCSSESRLLGDLDIIYELDVKNEKIPNTFYFITGNDYSNMPPKFLYKYGNMQEYSEATVEEVNCAEYKRNAIRSFNIELSGNKIPKTGNFIMKMKISYQNSFDFEKIPLDTIICLPQIYGDDIPLMEYTINIIDFPREETYYLFSYLIKRDKFGYERTVIENRHDDIRRTFNVTLHPNDIVGEKAYYFKVGTKDRDVEPRN